jgi:hypothetical protein
MLSYRQWKYPYQPPPVVPRAIWRGAIAATVLLAGTLLFAGACVLVFLALT